MVLFDLIQQPVIVHQEQDQTCPCACTGHDGCNRCSHRPVSILSGVNIDESANEADKRIEQTRSVIPSYSVSRLFSELQFDNSQKYPIYQPDKILIPSPP